MKDDADKVLGPLEAEIMRILWADRVPVSVRDVLEALNRARAHPLAFNTVMTVMNRLTEKDILNRCMGDRVYLYEPTVSDAAGIAVRGVVRDFGEAAVAHFVEEARADPSIMRRLERLMKGSQ